jgi:hypothetical protein
MLSDGSPPIYFKLREAVRPIVLRYVPNARELGEVSVEHQQDAVAWAFGNRSVSMGFVSTFDGPNVDKFVAISSPNIGRRIFHFNTEPEAVALLVVTGITTDQVLPVRSKDVRWLLAAVNREHAKGEPAGHFAAWAETVTAVLRGALCYEVAPVIKTDRAEWSTPWNRAVAFPAAVTFRSFVLGLRDGVEVRADRGRGCNFGPEVTPIDAGVSIANDLAGFGSLM